MEGIGMQMEEFTGVEEPSLMVVQEEEVGIEVQKVDAGQGSLASRDVMED